MVEAIEAALTTARETPPPVRPVAEAPRKLALPAGSRW
jgi:hypothetical protein